MRSALFLITLIAAAAFAGGGCRSSSEPEEILPFPIQLRATTPGDSVTVVSVPLTFTAIFNQDVSLGDIITRLIPAASDPGTATVQGRTFVLSQLAPSSSRLAHWMLLDGPHFLRPYLVRFFTGDARGDFIFPDPDVDPCLVSGDVGQVGQIIGNLFTSRAIAPLLQNSLVFAFEKESLGSDPKLENLLTATPVAVGLATLPGVPEEATGFKIENLIIDVDYTLMAIIDSNGDGRYEIDDDWWGYAHNFTTGRLIFKSAHVDQCTPSLNVEMLPPLESGLAP